MGLIERAKRLARKGFDDLGGTPVSPIEKPVKAIDESKLNIPNQPDPDEKNFGENPGHDVPGIYFIKGIAEKAPLSARREAKKEGKTIKKTLLFGALAVGLSGTILLVSKEIYNSKKKKKNKS